MIVLRYKILYYFQWGAQARGPGPGPGPGPGADPTGSNRLLIPYPHIPQRGIWGSVAQAGF